MARRSSEFWQDPEHIFQRLASQVTLPRCIIIFLCFWYVVRALDVVLGEQRCEAHAALGPAGPGKPVTPDRHLLTRTTNSMCHIDIANLQSRSLRRIRLSYYKLHLSGLATATRERCIAMLPGGLEGNNKLCVSLLRLCQLEQACTGQMQSGQVR